jgi:uncharacterized membrane protein
METTVRMLNGWVVSVCQLMALFVISTGIVKALFIYLKQSLIQSKTATAFQESRLQMGYSFSLGLGFLIGASILKTTIAPTWNDIGQLAAVIALRTVLNYLLLQAITSYAGTPNPSSESESSEHVFPLLGRQSQKQFQD